MDDLGQIREYVRQAMLDAGCEKTSLDELVVAVNEAVANIVKHSYRSRPGNIELTVICRQEELRVILVDEGPQFDPTEVPGPETTLPLVKRPFGGLGIHMMRDFCDGLNYRRDDQDRNELTLLKRLPPDDLSPG